MPAKDLGNKYVCWKCETKFYDLHKPVPLCPKCGTDQRERPAARPSRAAKAAPAKPVRGREIAAAAVEPDEEELVEAEEVEEEDGGDDEDVAPDEDDE